MISLATALETADILWPAFLEHEGCVLLSREIRDPTTLRLRDSRTATEVFYNHVHITDLFRHAIPAAEHPEHGYVEYDETHPDFERAWEVGRRLTAMWAAKLRGDFPGRSFRLYLTRRDTPILRFHEIRPDEPAWVSEADIAAAVESGELLVFDTGLVPASG